jgi:PKD repeat protein
MAFNSRGNIINDSCLAEGRMPLMPYDNNANTRNTSPNGCLLCHNDGPGGGNGAGFRAYRVSPRNLDFFCQLVAMNIVPVANAGPDQSVTAGDIVTLDGSGSMDADGDILSYDWMVTDPAGNPVMLSDATAVMPTFTATIAGNYVAELIVNDGTEDSAVDSVTILVTEAQPVNIAPVADAGMDQAVIVDDIVTLDGTGSSDADGDDLTYSWILTQRPMGSEALLSGADTAMPSFIADVEGDYLVELTVNDGMLDSAADTVVISATVENAPMVNIAPVADAGMDQNVQTGTTVMLDGSGSSDANNDPLAYSWEFTTMPMNSTAVLMDATTAMPSFVADLPGEYVAQLTVSDGLLESVADTVMIKVNDQPMITANVRLKLKVKPSKLKIKMEKFGEKAVKVEAKVKHVKMQPEYDSDMDHEDDKDDEKIKFIPVLVDIYVTNPDGSMEVLVQKHEALKKTSKVKARFMPTMEGIYEVHSTVTDEAGNELASETKSIVVMLKVEDHEEEDDDHDDDDDDDHEKDDHDEDDDEEEDDH